MSCAYVRPGHFPADQGYWSRSTLDEYKNFTLNLQAQDQTVQGKVTDATEGSPIIGANIVIKGTNTGTETDIEGNY
ncbi:MAG: carboxypeptidase-like regulatory domain-containing protein, partial [Cyclobacteriaceae bacterium]